MAFTNYYIVLGVKNTATPDEIKAAYRELAKKYHPDKNPDNKAAEDFFKEVQQAYMILSNTEKRRQFDLRFSYAHTQSQYQQAKQRTQTQYTQYTGSAYQYAQQQAQNRQARPQPQRTAKKPDKSENGYILISVGVAMLLLYFIISYASRTEPKKSSASVAQTTVEAPATLVPPAEETPLLSDNSTVYSEVFGEETFDNASRNQVIVYNSDVAEAIVCVVDQRTNKVIRCRYIAPRSVMEFHYVPDGAYFLRAYFGKDWDPRKTFADGTIRGGFRQGLGFVELNTGKNALEMKQKQSGSSIRSSSYEIHLDPTEKGLEEIGSRKFFERSE